MKQFIILIITISVSFSFDLQKPKTYDKNKHNINNWYMSEKLDGIRAYWDGKELLSKNGNKIYAPNWFTKDFPSFHLDGELWTKRSDFENIQNIVLDKTPSNDWVQITYNIFEVPKVNGDFLERLDFLKKWLIKNPNKYIKIIPQIKCKDKKHLEKYLNELINKSAEGIIIRSDSNKYIESRTNSVLKVKKFSDMEGEIISINMNKNRLKSLYLKIDDNIYFNLGGGFSKKVRENHPFKIGDLITFKYYGLTKNNKPKFASFLKIRKKE